MNYHCYFASLGCDKNLVDSEKMIAILGDHKVFITDDASEAEIIIVNTCGFILDAKQESIETILELAPMKTEGKCKALIVTGCLAERYREELREELPEVDAVVGTASYDSIWEAVEKTIAGERPDIMKPVDYLPNHLTKRQRTGMDSYRYLKIAEGCNKRCTYCAIPLMRGAYRSVPMEELVEETEILAEQGCKELILVAQETTLYGTDLYGKKTLPELLHRLCRVTGIEWIRLMYCYPEEITDDLLHAMKAEPKVCHYLDLPIQHADDEILRRMGRKTDQKSLIQRINTIRHILPDVSLRTTLISGFPGETEEQHQRCLDFVREMQFDRLGVFPYSEEEGTPAAGYDDRIPEEIRQKRADEIMQASEAVIFEKNRSVIGRSLSVLVEGYLPDQGCYIGRSYRDAPDIDGFVFFESEEERLTGDLVWVNITGANGYDLIGEPVEKTFQEGENT
ncbi:MAG: 30S ribosomal protein S12 methylthiotransferase RimO [Eubacterium sp.]|nr:30S ribosomal protein S12 methylthiotransferase RimO [Eubacterium sp.]